MIRYPRAFPKAITARPTPELAAVLYDPVTRIEVYVLAKHERGRRRIDPEHGQLLHVSFGREEDQTVRGNDHALPPSVAVER